LGWGYGVLFHAFFFGTTDNLTQGVGIISLFSLFILAPVFIIFFQISQVNEIREPLKFKNAIKNISAFEWLSLGLFTIGAFGAGNMIL